MVGGLEFSSLTQSTHTLSLDGSTLWSPVSRETFPPATYRILVKVLVMIISKVTRATARNVVLLEVHATGPMDL